MKKTIAILLCIVVIMTITGCGKTTEYDSSNKDAVEIPEIIRNNLKKSEVLKGKKLGCSIIYKGDEWCVETATAIETLAAYYGAKCVVEDGEASDEIQNKQIENMISNNCDMILVDATSGSGPVMALQKANIHGIPVLAYDSDLNGVNELAVSHVKWDQYDTGVKIADYFLNYVREHDYTQPIKIVEMTVTTSEHLIYRFQGFHDTVEAAEDVDVEVIRYFDTQANREIAYNQITSVVEPYDFVLAAVDIAAMGARAALQISDNRHVKILSMGGYGEETFSVLHDNDDHYLACLDVDAWIFAQTIINTAIDYFEGKELPDEVNMELYVVDSSNVEEFWEF